MKIGVIDSGIGGLTVLESLIKNYPKHEYIYFGDTLHIPYGEKSIAELVSYTEKILAFLESKKVEIIIIACGTLSSNREYLQSNVPLLDLISPLKGKLDKYKEVAIMATPVSIKKNAFQKYINSNIHLVSCPLLVPLIETRNYQNMDRVVKNYVDEVGNSEVLLLGCTHYPIVKNYIEKYYKNKIFTLDEFLLPKLKNLKETKYHLEIYFSKIDNKLLKNVTDIFHINSSLIKLGEVF